MATRSQLSARRRVLVVPAAILAILLVPASVEAQRGGHGGGHGGGHSRGHGGHSGHAGGTHGGGHASRNHSGHGNHSGHSSAGGRHHTGRHLGGHHHHRRHSSLFLGGSYYPYYPYGDYPYYPRHYGYGYYSYGPRPYGNAGVQAGAIDFDVSPADARVYVDGEYVGLVDDFDGSPSYLWLSPGTVELAFELEGYRTVVRDLRVVPGQVLGIGDTLQPDGAIAPAVPRRGSPRQPAGSEWRAPSGPTDVRQQPGRLRLTIIPADAAVYLDGRFVGSAHQLAQGLLVDAGHHELEVARPGRRPAAWSFDVAAGGDVERTIELQPE